MHRAPLGLLARRARWAGLGSRRPTRSPAAEQLRCRQRNVAASAQRYASFVQHLDQETRAMVERVLEKAESAADRWSTATTDFFYPPVQQSALDALSRLASASGVAVGGYAGAERRALVVGHPEVVGALGEEGAAAEGIAALQVDGNFLFDPATHRDFLGAILATGIERGCVGDVIVNGEKGCHLLIKREVAMHVTASLTSVRTVPVAVTEVPFSDIIVPETRAREVRSVEASLRVDAVASAGFGVSRGKMADLVSSGDVKVNWRVVSKPSATVHAGDVISCTGKGRVEVRAVTETAKGRYAVEMLRLM